MTPTALSRRTVLTSAAVATAAAVLPWRVFDPEAAAAPASRGVFGYGVASGDPRADRVIIWTRATPPGTPIASPGSGRGAPLTVVWEVALDPRFRRVVRFGVVRTDARTDHTVKVDVSGLATYTRYYYRFRAAGETSPTGVTRTAPDDARETHALRFALVSCSNYTGGYFGAYRALAARTDLDFVLHVGDYLYEYGNGEHRYGPDELRGTRDAQPDGETIDLAGYRLRHALHKADPDLRAAHQNHPFITIFDDHEIANNAWARGAANHQPGHEGNFARRRREALRAYLEWMPFRLPSQLVPHRGTRFFRRFTFGTLADLSVLETRQNRSKQVDVAPFTKNGGGLVPFDDDDTRAALTDPGRNLLESAQMDWLERGLNQPRDWHLIGNQVVLSPIRFPGRPFGVDADVVLNSDQWDGYQTDQRRVVEAMATRSPARGDAVVLTGDIHSSWACDIPRSLEANYTSAGVEFVCPSITSDGFYESFRASADDRRPAAVVARVADAADELLARNSWVKYLDGVGHGFVVVDVTPERVQGDFHLTPTPSAALPDPRVVPETVPTYRLSYATERGSRTMLPATRPIGARGDEPATQPAVLAS